MPSSGSDGPLHDMRRHIELARTFTGSMTFTEFKADRRTVLAAIYLSKFSRGISPNACPVCQGAPETLGVLSA